MSFDPQEEQRERERAQRERERDLERAQREIERERERAERDREREQRRDERRARHEERHAFRFARHGFDVNVDIDPDKIARSVSSAFVGLDEDDGESHDETVEKTFVVEGMPRLRVRNVSGETNIHVGDAGQVRVVARKRVKGGSNRHPRRRK